MMTPLLTPLAFSLIASLLLIDGASAWHTEIPDHDMLAFGISRRGAPVATKREITTTSRRRKGAAHLVDSRSRSCCIHPERSSHASEYSHSVDPSSKSTPRHSKQQETRTPFVRGDHGNTTEEENETELVAQLVAATDVTACMSDFGCF
jgi:hypothetical protein